jgi:RNA polymerase sigma-70 factor, ECF subfamily
MAWDRPGQRDDPSLVREVVRGSHDALAVLYDRYADGIYAAAGHLTNDRQLAEEVVQETFLALWNRAELYDPAAGSLAAWLNTIARNRTVDRLRAAARRPKLVPPSTATRPDADDGTALERLAHSAPVLGGSAPEAGPESLAESAWVRAAIKRVLAVMPESERTVIVLAYQEELSQTEIAQRLGWPLGTVKTRTRRALAQLREVLAPQLGAERTPAGAAESSPRRDGMLAGRGLGLVRDKDGSR